MGVLASDDFNRANGTIEAGNPNWNRLTADVINIVSNRAHWSQLFCPYSYSVALESADYSVSCDMVPAGVGSQAFSGPAGRFVAANRFYNFRYRWDLAQWELGYLNGVFSGGFVRLGAAYSDPGLKAGTARVATLRMRGNTISGLVDGVERVRVTDSTYTTGLPGLYMVNNAVAIDNFSVSELPSMVPMPLLMGI